ncbi:phosphatase PAP2 family protein [Ruegeria sp. 2205SS24-7]|uniref:phosphatase PAP2 family protein n=1 Tax=Ruegeria discodermiae TaxID=3064389 RepID=UPI0027428AFA|nr:phosphatase PAP2 family protein [Ruegeria sp. 2205SS24-7]MDP5215763.1 phosphatase PAP2 family protein [Ruegeria sp. 2205SS24-7]
MSMRADVSTEQSVVAAAIWRNRLLLGIVLVHLLAALWISNLSGTAFWTGSAVVLMDILKRILIVSAAGVIFWRLAYGLIYVKPKKPIQWYLSDLRSFLLDLDKLLDWVIRIAAIAVMSTSFTFLKDVIPALNPYSWDVAFAGLDRILHFGTDPWQWLWPALGTPEITRFLDISYGVWFILLYVGLFAAIFGTGNPARGMVFLVAFTLTWIIGGNVLATLFSSAGPVYFEAFGFGSQFGEQMQRLNMLDQVAPLWALDAQQMLLDNYNSPGTIRGISAMPSMHVATSVVLTMFAFSYARWLGLIMVAFTGLILIGSVHLGWHYAVDGYVSIPLTVAIWFLSKALVRRFGPTSDQTNPFAKAC